MGNLISRRSLTDTDGFEIERDLFLFQLNVQLCVNVIHYFHPFRPISPKLDYFGVSFFNHNTFCKILRREILRTAKSTIILQILSYFMLNYKVIIKSIIDPDDNCHGGL